MLRDTFKVKFPANITQLHYYVARSSNERVATICVEDGAKPEGGRNGNPLVAAAAQGHDGMVRLLLEAGANPNTSQYETSLVGVVGHGHAGVLRTLLKCRDIDINLAKGIKSPPLHLAAQRGNAEAVKLLLEHPKIEVIAVHSLGNTAFMIVAEEGKLDAVRALFKRRDLDVAAINKDRLTALDLAKANKRDKVVAEMETFLANFGAVGIIQVQEKDGGGSAN
jgi:ankyrin repeat protein